MGPVSRWAVRRPWPALTVWLLLAVLIGLGAAKAGGSYNDSFELPDTESAAAQQLLSQIPGVDDALTTATVKVVWSPESGTVDEEAVKTAATHLLQEIADVPSVTCVATPYGEPLGDCPSTAAAADADQGDSAAKGQTPGEGSVAPPTPEQARVLAGMGPSGIGLDKTVAFATVSLGAPIGEVPLADARTILHAVEAANGVNGITVGASGQALEAAASEPPSSEGIGVTIALVILLFAFGSIVGAFLPILTAVLALSVGQAIVLITANFLSVATFAPTLAAMIGLGVGIDYSLFVMSRYKQALEAGREPRAAAMESVRTAGRAVVFAAITVTIALSGLFVIGFEFFNGLAVASIATVFMMLIGATFLLPAILSLLGRRAFALRMPWARRARIRHPEGAPLARYGHWLSRHFRVVGAAALALMVVLASPVASMRLGFTDDGGRPEGSPARIAYDLVAEGFGPGVNGPYTVAVETATPGDNAALGRLTAALSSAEGVAVAVPLPLAPDASITAVQVIPTTAPQDEATAQLLETMREDLIPPVAGATGLTAHVGGTQAITADFTSVLTDSLPVFLLVVIGFGFLALVLLFRSILVPLTGVLTSLLSLGAAMGMTVAVFQWGWFADLLGVPTTGPIQPFLPIMVFAILFGLSMDYHVFLVSRMQEEWGHTGDNGRAVRRGLAASGRVVMVAAAIMISVFAAFILSTEPVIKLFGLALSAAVLFDAFVVRLVIVPALMTQLGRANWWLPGWLDRVLPAVAVESEEDSEFAAAEIEDIPDSQGDTAVAGAEPDGHTTATSRG
jgi:RND superfamily putative drug exporter